MQSKLMAVVVVGCLTIVLGPGLAQELGIRERLSRAAMQGDTSAVERLIAEGALVDEADELGYTPLMLAVRKGRTEAAKVLLRAGANVNAVNQPDGERTALHYAALHGRAEIARMLVRAGADVEARRRGGMTPLGQAAAVGASEVVRVLLAAGANIDRPQEERGWTPLMLALEQGEIETARILLEAGANANYVAKDLMRPITLAAGQGDVGLVRELLGRGAQISVQTGGSMEAYASALEGGYTQAAMILRRMYLEQQGRGRSPEALRERRLLEAAYQGDAPTVLRLVEGGALVGVESVDLARRIAEVEGRIDVLRVLGGPENLLLGRAKQAGWNVNEELVRAIWFGDMQWAEGAIQFGADPNAEVGGRPVLFEAVEAGRREMVELLLGYGADPNVWDARRRLSAVGAALVWGRMDVYQSLREHGATAEGLEGSAALWRALWNRRAEIVRVLLELGVNPNRKEKLEGAWGVYEVPPLIEAACWGDPRVVRWLIEAGAQVDVPDSLGATALAHALAQQRHEVAQVLREAGAKEPMDALPPAYWWAIRHQDMQRLKELLEARVPIDPEHDPLERRSPVRLAIHVRWPEGALALVEGGAWVYPPPQDLDYPKPLLMSAVEMASAQDLVWARLLEQLIQRGDDVNARYVPTDPELAGQYPSTALMMAAYQGKAEIVSLLLIRGADPTIRDDAGRDAVAWAEMEVRREPGSRLPPPGSAIGRDRSRRLIAVTMEQRGINPQDRRR